MDKYYYGYEEFLYDIRTLHQMIRSYGPDTLLAVARGGLTMGHFLANAMDTRRLFALNSIHYNGTKKLETMEIFNIPDLSDARKVLILDDIADSGETLVAVLEKLQERYPEVQFKIATLFHKPESLIRPDFTLKEPPAWIDFFWEVDPL
ncbi:phosphoribosyltransferase [Nitratifractor salsuginis]|uniref:Phosphoribosyltransferase n=1 Tax=Nitratifractor salsuginis (strain DSM 16511 / JCM 12458 / E9I37-1) TaxID=749222 RepID=E6X185_NITSE|nr:phosphoribosyltransferase family protein [Nitratifractor salsuginis]ADV46947.1 phosphoribosyltransferase [Nitratifractor salsuginis DSM 16511]